MLLVARDCWKYCLVISLGCISGNNSVSISILVLFFYCSYGKELVHGFLKLYPNTHTPKQDVEYPTTEK